MATGEQDIAVLVNFPTQINNVAKAVAATTLGPYRIYVTCSYDAGCKDCEYSTGVEISTAPIVELINDAQTSAKTFFTSFQPVTNWLQQTLPSFSVTFDASAKIILAILKIIGSSRTITPAQQAELIKQFDIIQNGLTQSETELGQGNIAMVAFVNRQNTATLAVQSVQNSLEADTQNALTRMLDYANGQPCGQSDAKAQYNVMEASYKGTVNTLSIQFTELSNDTNTANNAVKSLVGLVVDFIGQMQNISASVNTVQNGDLSNFMKQVTIMATTDLWTNLAQEANHQFGTNKKAIQEVNRQIASI
ncbi:hypothetical protein [Lacinutrix sp. MEBiC02595]